MKIYQGKSILKGITIGKILYYSKEEQMGQRRSIIDTEAEWKRYEEAKEQASKQLNALYEKARYSKEGCTKDDVASFKKS